MKRYLKTITRQEGVRQILESVLAIGDEEYLPVYECRTRITSRPVFARFSNPPYLCSAMDGYAVDFEKTLACDLTNPLTLFCDRDVWRVNTGDPLPPGTNGVAMVEDVEESEAGITIRKPVYLWQHVRMVGEDVIEGDMLATINHRVMVPDIGLFIATGVTRIHVRRRPRILIIPTGRELRDVFEEERESMEKGTLVDFNSYTLWMMAEGVGYEAERNKIVRDKDELESIINNSVEAFDVIAINAGSSAGSEDFTEDVIRSLGALSFHGVSMMPGKPVMFGVIRGKPVFGVPGYPVSAAVCFDSFLIPLYEKLSGTSIRRREVQAVTPYKIPSRIGIEEVIRVTLSQSKDRYYAFPLPRGASIFSSVARADGIIRVPWNVEGFNEGETIVCELVRQEEEIRGRMHITGSHDLSLDVLRDLLRENRPGLDLFSSSTGSLSGIMAFQKGIADLCTTHILDEHEGIYNVPVLKKYVTDRPWRLVHIAKRLQGLVVRKGNPKGIKSLHDLCRGDVKVINRQSGSGTRILFDTLLKDGGIDKGEINGYDREESSHTAVAILIKEAVADTGLAIYGVAKAFSLDFIPLAEEDYDLLVSEEFAADERFALLMELLTSEAFRTRLEELGGYNTKETGKVKYVSA